MTAPEARFSGDLVLDEKAIETPSHEARGFSMPIMTDSQTYHLHIVTVSTAGLSLTAGLVVLTWLLRMRRSFRHDLIMLLVCSDMFKAIWTIVFPAVEITKRGTVPSSSAFCQVSGFFLSLSIETTDLCIAMISMHTALYIFRGREGLYPYRRYAYACSFFLAALLASLVLINNPRYVNTGQFCYLPYDPLWKRLILSWLPRYIAFATILVLCVAIYAHVRASMRRFGSGSDGSKHTQSTISDMGRLESSVPAIPSSTVVNSHGIDFSTTSIQRPSFSEHVAHQSRYPSTPNNRDTPVLSHPAFHSARASRRFSAPIWSLDQSTAEPASPNQSTRRGSEFFNASSSDTTQGPEHYREAFAMNILPPSERRYSAFSPQMMMSSGSFEMDLARMSPRLSRSAVKPRISSMADTSVFSSEPDTNGSQPRLQATGMVKSRAKILRQLRLMFIYPLVYVAVWILPFIVHLTSYGKGAPFGMRLASIVSFSLQGFANAVVFSLKEKPWRHSRPFSVQDFKLWKRRSVSVRGPGRTREEMMVDGRLARERMEQEMADRKVARQARQDAHNNCEGALEEGDVYW